MSRGKTNTSPRILFLFRLFLVEARWCSIPVRLKNNVVGRVVGQCSQPVDRVERSIVSDACRS